MKLGHYGFIVPKSRYRETLDWYLAIMNLKSRPKLCLIRKSGEDENVFSIILILGKGVLRITM